MSEVERILRERAAVLARAVTAPAYAASAIEVVGFALGQDRYAIESRYVREVRALEHLAPVPGVPQFVLGVVNVRRRIVSVIDLGSFFGRPAQGLSSLNRVVVVADDAMEFGILADAVHGVQAVGVSELQPGPPGFGGVREEFLIGITRDSQAVLDGRRLLGSPRLRVRDERAA